MPDAPTQTHAPQTAPTPQTPPAPQAPRAPTLQDWLLLSVLVIIWGGAFALIGIGLQTAPPAVIVMSRMWIGAGLMLAWSRHRRRTLPGIISVQGRKAWIWFITLGLVGLTLPFTCIAVGQQHIEPSVAGILMAIMPLTTVALAHFFVPGERMTLRKITGFVIGLSGLLILFGPDTFHSAFSGLGNSQLLSQLLILTAAIAYAVNTILAKRAPDLPPSVTAAGMLIAAAIMATPWGVMELIRDHDIAPASWAAIIGLGLGATGLGSILYMQIIRTVGPSFFAMVNYFVPVTAAFLGLLLGDALGWTAFLALAVILAGVGIANAKSSATPKP